MKMKMPRHSCRILIACLCGLVIVSSAFAQTAPPVTPVREVTDEYFGQKIVDPYRWMEDLKSPEMVAWMKAQSDYARAYLDRLPTRGELLKRITELSDAGVAIFEVKRAGNMYFYYRLAPGDNDRKLCVRDAATGAERVLIDPEKLSSAGKRYSIDRFSPSLDGKFVSYRISTGGSEIGELRIVETATGSDLGERVDRVRYSVGLWLPDGKSFLYNRLQKLPEGAPPTEKYQKSRVHLHVLGTNPDNDKAVFGYGVNPNIKLESAPRPFPYVPRGSKYVFVQVDSSTTPNSEFYVTPLSAMHQPVIPWRKIAALEDEIANADVHGDDLYLLTYKNTPRYKVIRTRLSNPDLPKAMTVFPAGEAVVKNIGAARDALYVQTLDAGMSRIWRVNYGSNKAEALKLPYDGSAYIGWTDQETDGVLFSLNSWTKSPAYFAYDPKTGTAIDTKFAPPIPVDMFGVEVRNVKVKSFDGTMIPLVILYKKGLKRDGANPTLLFGYGAYGFENTSPSFFPPSMAWLERGGVMAFSGVRGGGEYGEEWHLAGKGATKPNTWKDFIACAEYLVSEKYTTPKHLAGLGASAGGILIGNAIAERPDLFTAAIDDVGVNNALRDETTSSGVPNIPEFGSTKTKEGFRALLAMDAYHKIKPGVRYPAVLLTTGINDPRVAPWMSAKMAARLQADSTIGRPILLRVDFDAGHGLGSTKKQLNERLADVFAFLFEQLGASQTKDGMNK